MVMVGRAFFILVLMLGHEAALLPWASGSLGPAVVRLDPPAAKVCCLPDIVLCASPRASRTHFLSELSHFTGVP